MANPTTNFGWVMPTATDLVTDLPADFAVFGQGVDTSMAYLLGGTTGQILSKTSGTNMAFTWINNDQGDITGITATSPLTGGGSSGAITVGIQDATTSVKGSVQLSDSTSTTSSVLAATPTAVKSAYDLAAAAIATSTLTTAGDTLYRNATVPARLGIGTVGQVLTVNSGATAPEWSTPAGATAFPTFSAYRNTSTQTISSGVYTKLQFNAEEWDTNSNYDPTTNYRFTPTVAGYYDINLQTQIYIATTGYIVLRLYFNGSAVRQMTSLTGVDLHPSLAALLYFNGSTDYVEAYAYTSGSGNFDNAAVNQGNYFSGVGIRS